MESNTVNTTPSTALSSGDNGSSINPKTGDNIIMFVAIFAVALVGVLFTIRKVVKSKKASK